MKKDKPITDEDKPGAESETQEMTTLFSSDNTELTDFTQRVKQAIRGEQPDRRCLKTATTPGQASSTPQGGKPSTSGSNVVNLFKPE